MIHMYLLQPEEFQKTYVVWDKSRPFSAQQEKFCQASASSLEIEPNRAILSAYQAAYSTKGKSDEIMLSEGLKIASTLKDYIDFLKLNDGRIMISPYDAKMLEKIKQNIQSHKLANKIVWPIGYAMKEGYCTQFRVHVPNDKIFEPEDAGYYHEFHINWEYKGVQCKSLLDGLTLDFKNKKAIIYDLKTTQKLWHFEDSIDQYDYLRQLCYYTMAVKWYLKNEYGDDPDKWDFF